jgi:acyl dehydratase
MSARAKSQEFGQMFLRAALTVVPRPRPATLPSTVESFSASSSVAAVASYNAVCGFPLSDSLPPTYPHIMAFERTMRLMSGSDFPFPVVGLVHIGNRLVVRSPLPLDQPLFFTVRALNLRPHRRGRQFDVVTTASLSPSSSPGSGGSSVPDWEETSTYLRRGASSSVAEEADLSPVEGSAVAVWKVGTSVGRSYAAVSGDHNPIHTSLIGARAFGFRRPIAHGMWTKARLLSSLRLPAAFEVDVRFRAPIFLGSRVSLHTAGERADVRGGDRLHLTASLTRLDQT